VQTTLQLALDNLLPPLQTRMLCDDRPRDGKEGRASALAAELRLGPYVEECPVSGNEMVRNASRLVQDVNLP